MVGLWPSLNNLSYLFPSDQMVTPRWNDPVYPSNFIPRNTPSCKNTMQRGITPKSLLHWCIASLPLETHNPIEHPCLSHLGVTSPSPCLSSWS